MDRLQSLLATGEVVTEERVMSETQADRSAAKATLSDLRGRKVCYVSYADQHHRHVVTVRVLLARVNPPAVVAPLCLLQPALQKRLLAS